MADNFEPFRLQIDKALVELGETGSLDAAIHVAIGVLALLDDGELPSAQSVIDGKLLQLPNAERQDSWFVPHPWMRGERSAFDLLDSDCLPIQAKLFWLQRRSSSLIAGATHFSKNWEDFEFTRSQEFKVGIDFFLTPDAKSVLVVLSNLGNLRVLELSERLSNTQIDVLKSWLPARGQTDRARLHGLLWESFKLQSVNSKFFAGVSDLFQELVAHLARQGKPEEESKLFVNRLLGRLIFVWFLRKMGLISEGNRYFECVGISGHNYYTEVLSGLFFGVLNRPVEERESIGANGIDTATPYLNGGLFAPREGDMVEGFENLFPVDFFERLFEHFGNFNFTTDESTPEYEQVAIDPEMLGRVFESLLAAQIEESGEQARKAKGAFYTPREIVAYICREGIRAHLCASRPDDTRLRSAVSKLIDTPDQEWALAGSNSLRDIPEDLRLEIATALRKIRTIDPACGSGAFPLGLVHLLSKLQMRLDPRLDELRLKLAILRDNIYGVDIEPMAVEISRLRSWLSIIVSEQGLKQIEPLPNLEFNFVCADSLVRLEEANILTDPELQSRLSDIRERYFSATKPKEKEKLQRDFEKFTKPDLFDELDGRNKQLKTFSPFSANQVASFFDPEVMFGNEEGFDLVLGNPPYVDSEFMSKRTPSVRQLLKSTYKTTKGNWDLYIPFIERGVELTKQGGVVSYIVKNSLLGAPYASALRTMLAGLEMQEVRDFGGVKLFESASVDTCVFRVRNAPPSGLVRFSQMASTTNKVSESLVDPLRLGNTTSWITFTLPTEVQEILEELSGLPSLRDYGITGGAAATVSEAYKIAEFVTNNPSPREDEKKFVNTGTIDPFKTKWGEVETKYLGSSYSHPTVQLSALEAINPVRAAQAASPKIIVNGMGNVEAYLDEDGSFLAGKTTSALYPSGETGALDLPQIVGLLNSSLSRFWFKANFLISGMGGLNAENLLSLPVPQISSVDSLSLSNLSHQLAERIDPEWRKALDELVFRVYGLPEHHIATIKAFIGAD